MRRLGFVVVDKEIGNEEEDDGLEFGSGVGFCSPTRVSLEIERPRMTRPPRRSFRRRSVSLTPSSSLSSLSSSWANLRQSFQYERIPSVPIRLTVVKLDGSRFGIEVQKGATISDLKQAVQEAFWHMPTKGPGKISWRHVWGNFCLSYGGEKLVKDDDLIKDYGIKDGDQLHFVRHVSISYNLIKKQSRKRSDAPKASRRPEIEEESDVEDDDCDRWEKPKCQEYRNENESPIADQESVFSSLFRGWFVYSRLESANTSRFEVEAYPSRLEGGFFSCFRTMFHFYSNKPSYHPRVSQIEI